MQGGLECFSLTLLLISSLLQHQICPGLRLDVTGFGAGATLTHLSHSLNLSGAQSMDCWVYPSDFGSALPCQA